MTDKDLGSITHCLPLSLSLSLTNLHILGLVLLPEFSGEQTNLFALGRSV